MRRLVAALLGGLAIALAAGCGGTWSSMSSTTATHVQIGSPCRGKRTPARYDHVIVVVMENHGFSDVAGHSPYLNALAKACGLATDYAAVAHPSLPNYLALTSGSTQGIMSDCTDCTVAAPSLFGQLHGNWRSYVESLPRRGFEGASSGRYAKKHNPAAYYVPIATAYARNAVPVSALRSDLAQDKLSRFSLVVPNLCSDEHNCSLATGDAWLRQWLPLILRSPTYRSGNTAVFVTYDEGPGDNTVYTVVAAESVVPRTSVGDDFDHYSLLRTAEDLLGLPCLAEACRAHPMEMPFHLAS